MGSAYFLGFVGGCLFTNRLVSRVGQTPVFAAMVAGASLVPLILVLVVATLIWWVLRATTGFCMAALFLVIESWLNEKAENRTRGSIFSVYTTLNYTAITVGQLLITLHDPALFPLFAIASVLVSLAAIPVALTGATAPAPLSEVRLRPLYLVRLSPVGVAGCAAIGMCNGAFWSLGPAFAAGIGLSTTEIAIFMSVTVIGGALSQWPFGRLSDRVDRRIIIITGSLLAASAGLGIYLATDWMPAAIAPLAFAFGAFSFPIYALSVAHVNDHITTESFVEVTGGLLLVNGISAVIGPLLASAAIDYAGPEALFLFTASIYLLLTLFILLRMRVRAAPPDEQRADFVVVADSVASSTRSLDPRIEEEAEREMAETGGAEEPLAEAGVPQ